MPRVATRQWRGLWLAGLALAVSVGLAACGGDGGDTTVIVREKEKPRSEQAPQGDDQPSKVIEEEPQAEQGDEAAGQGSGGGELGIALPATLTVGEITSFQQQAGQPQWAQNAQARLQTGVWELDDSGNISFNADNLRTDLYPIQGTYQRSGSKISFSLSGQVQTTVALTTAEMVGSIDTSADPPTMHIAWANGNGVGAVVNETKFGSSATAAYLADLTVVAR